MYVLHCRLMPQVDVTSIHGIKLSLQYVMMVFRNNVIFHVICLFSLPTILFMSVLVVMYFSKVNFGWIVVRSFTCHKLHHTCSVPTPLLPSAVWEKQQLRRDSGGGVDMEGIKQHRHARVEGHFQRIMGVGAAMARSIARAPSCQLPWVVSV